MTAYRFCCLGCDECGTEEGWDQTIALARAACKAAGWVRRKGKDLCPACASGNPVPTKV